MIYVSLPKESENINRRLGFYLAMEEYLASYRDEYGLFFMWQVDPTVICGRNQEVEKETDLHYCRREGIDVVRRKSGGGCVFADRSNIMFSYIAKSSDVRTTFSEYTGRVASMLRELGLDASDNARNDILIGDRKVSGCAFYHLPGRSIVHGTMLYDTDGRHIANALTPSRAKLSSKGVKSVESRITTIRSHLPSLTLEGFKSHARASLCGDRQIELTAEDMGKIEELERHYYKPEWTFRTIGKGTGTNPKHLPGIGEIALGYTVDTDGRIDTVSITGDFFNLADADEALTGLLKGVEPTAAALSQALDGHDLSAIIDGLDVDTLIGMITSPDSSENLCRQE